jgi:DNA-binding PadR family transcriptional regulator
MYRRDISAGEMATAPQTALTPTGKAILGTLSFGPKSGYEIKGMVDRSTRFFWAASYGQIYPELRRLADAGLIAGEEAPQGGRRRTVYALTAAGEAALRDWLSSPPETYEMRHEGMLKVFFAGALADPGARLERLRDMASQHRQKVAALREIEPAASQSPESFPYLVLRFGIESNEWIADWCEAKAEDLEEGGPRQARAARKGWR